MKIACKMNDKSKVSIKDRLASAVPIFKICLRDFEMLSDCAVNLRLEIISHLLHELRWNFEEIGENGQSISARRDP